MQTIAETKDLARVLGIAEGRVRRLIARGDIAPSARTYRGTALFDDQAIERARETLAQERKAS